MQNEKNLLKRYATMILKRKAETLQNQLQKERDKNARLAGYSLLPKAPQTEVRTVPDSKKYKTPSGNSCIGYWENKTKCEIKDDAVYYCPSCSNRMSKKDSTLDGAHVFKPNNPDEWFFVPLCSTCNNPTNTDIMIVDTVLVPVPDECYEERKEE